MEVDIIPVHEGEPDGPEDDGADAEVEPVLEEDVDGVLGADGAGLHEGEAALHEEDCGGEREAEEVVHLHGNLHLGVGLGMMAEETRRSRRCLESLND